MAEINYNINDELSDDQKEKLVMILDSFNDIFATDTLQYDPTPLIEHRIDFFDESSVAYTRPYRMSIKEQEILEKKAQELLKAGMIQSSISPFNSPVLLIKKPNGGYRLVCDMRKVNKLTKPYAYCLPRIDTTIDELSNQKWFTSIVHVMDSGPYLFVSRTERKQLFLPLEDPMNGQS